jgi:septal ring factor EnvC (AmiA/AmiB activator)
MNHAVEALKRERSKILQEVQSTATLVANLREQLKDAETKGQSYERSLRDLDGSILALSQSAERT